jgi:hypothetical protein
MDVFRGEVLHQSLIKAVVNIRKGDGAFSKGLERLKKNLLVFKNIRGGIRYLTSFGTQVFIILVKEIRVSPLGLATAHAGQITPAPPEYRLKSFFFQSSGFGSS